MQTHNRRYLKETRRALRNQMTAAEATLWLLLKSSQLDGRKFRRQHSIENYIADFYCASEKLVIELDGSVHRNPGQCNADFHRDTRLRKMGYRVIRFENNLVFKHPSRLLEIIRSQFSENRKQISPDIS